MGRDITGTIASFRQVDFRNAGIGFVMSMNPAALRGAPHTWIATVYAEPEAEDAILRAVTDHWPNVTGIAVGEAMGIGVGTNVLDTEQRLDAALEKGVPYGCGLALAEPIDAATVEQLIDESSTDGAG